ncbi:MAG: CDP-alcohol phosphatidyltransferase family protein [Actinobacteria bacterium]|nr:CDP-alcohol phosphatidyltransferase family protein [Alphaproteobacteria bacterium]MBM4438048.1 CDP-alcohol phosphatidyltransferase family protein [Actinomycetota bacterium]
MNTRPGPIGISDVRASQDLSKASIPLVMRHLFVPAAWPLTVAAARLGLSPNGATALHAAISAAGLILMASASKTLFAFGLILFVLAKISDSVDGNLARLQDRASYFGKYVDGLVDMIEDLAFPFALGLHLWRTGAPADHSLVPAGLAVLALAVVFIAIYRLPMFELILEKDRGTDAAAGARAAHPGLASFFESRPGRILLYCDTHGVNVAFDARFLGLAWALLIGGLAGYLEFLAALYVIAAILFVCARVMRGYAALDIHRRSRSAA